MYQTFTFSSCPFQPQGTSQHAVQLHHIVIQLGILQFILGKASAGSPFGHPLVVLLIPNCTRRPLPHHTRDLPLQWATKLNQQQVQLPISFPQGTSMPCHTNCTNKLSFRCRRCLSAYQANFGKMQSVVVNAPDICLYLAIC